MLAMILNNPTKRGKTINYLTHMLNPSVQVAAKHPQGLVNIVVMRTSTVSRILILRMTQRT